MKTLLAAVLVALTAGVVYTQNPPRAAQPSLPPPVAQIPAPSPALQPVPMPSPPTQRGELTIEQTLDELEHIRAQKASLEKFEQELTKQLQRKLEKQAERVNRLGIGAPMQPPPVISYN